MGYALFANRKLLLDSQLNSLQLQQQQRANEQYQIATDNANLKKQLTSIQTGQATELKPLYDDLATAPDQAAREAIQSQIEQKENEFKIEINELNSKIEEGAIKENMIELEVKNLDTKVTVMQKQLEACEQAESAGIDRATPKFAGLG